MRIIPSTATRAVADISGHLLRANQHALDFRIVDRRIVRARARVDIETRAGEQLDGCVLQRSLRDAEFERV